MTERRWLTLLLIAFIALGVTYSLATPLFEAHDESSHLTLVRYLVIHRALPPRVLPSHRFTGTGPDVAWSLSFHDPPLYYAPPLYYTLAALLTSWTRMDDLPMLLVPSPSWEAGYSPRANADPWNKNVFAHRAEETFVRSETVRAAYLLRLVSLGLGAVTVTCTYALALLLWPGRPNLALGSAALMALNPHFVFLSSGATNDSLLIAIFALFFVSTIRRMRDGARWTQWAALGGLAGLGLLTKQTALMLLPLGGLAMLGQKDGLTHWRKLLADAAAFFTAALAIGGWWYLRNALLYNDPLGLETHLASQTPLAYFGFSKALMIFYSYWAAFGWKLILVEPVVYGLVGLMVAASFASLVATIWPRGAFWRLPAMTQRGLAWLAVAALLNVGALVRWAISTGTSDGRLLFPTLAATGILIAWGLAQWARWRIVRYSLIVMTALAFLFAASVPWRYIRPALASPRQPMPSTAQSASAVFSNGLRLIGYELPADRLRPGSEIPLALYWQTPSALNHRYRTWVQLGPQDATRYVAGQDVWLGGTLYPSELWEAGDTVRQAYRLSIPPSVAAPSLYWIRLGVMDEQGTSLALADSDEDRAVLGPWRMMATFTPSPSHRADFRLGEAIRLSGYDLEQEPTRGTLRLTLYWQTNQTLSTEYTVFVHLMDTEGHLLGQQDNPPAEGEYPTSWWLPRELVVDRHTIQLNIPYTGSMRLRIGMYDSATLTRVPAYDGAGRRLPEDIIPLAEITFR
jgi:Dolichyl-phosphate-mannose-protein mannosyltransferase